MERSIPITALLNEITDQRHLYVVREEDEQTRENEEPEERLWDEVQNVVFLLREAEAKQRA